jgi:TonB family protein
MIQFLILSLLFQLTIAAASDPSFLDIDDTGDDSEEEVKVDPIDLWPEKIVMDANQNALLLVWFNTSPPRNTKVPFDAIKYFQLIPTYELRPAELQIVLYDERVFLMDFGKNTRQSAQTLSAITLSKLQKKPPNTKRILPEKTIQRNAPIIVADSIDSPNALLPPSQRLESKEPNKEEGKNSESTERIGSNIDDEKAKGKVSKTSVDMVIKSEMSRFRGCYIREVTKNPNLSGHVKVQFAISNDGTVSGSRILESSLNSPVVEQCILKQIYGLQFDPPVGGTAIIVYPFAFSATGL